MAEIKKINTEFQLLDKFLDTSGDAGTSGQVLSSTASGVNWVSGGSLPGGPYLPLAGGTLTGTLTVGADANGHDVVFYGNATGEKMIWNHNSSRLQINHDTDDSGLDIFTVSSATMTQPQLRVGRNQGQYWGVYTDDRNAHLVHKQDETTGAMTTRFDQWDNNTSDTSGSWLWRHGTYTGGAMTNALVLTQAGDATFAGNVDLLDSKKILLGTGNDFQLYHDGTHGVLNNTTGNLYTSAQGSMMFRTSLNVTALTLDASQNAIFYGNVGIGTTSPGAKLDVSQTTTGIGAIIGNTTHNSQLQIYTAAASKNSEIWFGDAADADVGKIDYDHANDSMSFFVGATKRLSIDSAGTILLGDNTTAYQTVFFDPTPGTVYGSGTLQIQPTTSPGSGVAQFTTNFADRVGGGTTKHNVRVGGTVTATDFIGGNGAYLPLAGGTMTGQIIMGNASSSFSHELKFANNTYIAGIDFQTSGELRFIDRSGGRESITFNLLNGSIEARNTGNTVTNFISTSGNSYLNGGNVGIGTTSPDKKLEVSGDIKISGGDYNGLFFENASGTTKTLLYQHASYDALVIKDIVNNADRVTFKNSGNVGIGTTSPNVKLEILQSGTNEFPTLGTADGNLYLTDGGLWGMFMGVDSSSGTGWIQQMRNDSAVAYDISLNPVGGNVGIGTTNPSNILHTYVNNTDTSVPGILVEQAGSGDSSIGFLLSGVRTWSVGVDNSDSDKFKIGSGEDLGTSSKMVIDTSGNVGIGTTSPDAPLTVTNNAVSSYIINVNMADDVDGGGFYEAAGGMELYLKDTSGTGQVKLTSSGSSYLNGGNVGIGAIPRTISTYKVLDISGSGGAGGYIGLSSGSTQQGELYSHSGGVDLVAIGAKSTRFFTNAVERMRINSSGNVGIGTTNPETDLMIYDTVSEDPAQPGYATTGMFALNRSGQATLSVGVNSSNVYWMSNVNRAFTGPNYYGISLNPLGGNVGIGTTTPARKLEVDFTGSVFGARFTRSDATGSSIIEFANSSGVKSIIGYDAGVDGFQIGTTSATNFVVKQAGNVGIGTTSPSAQLQIDTPAANQPGQGLRLNRPSAGTNYHSIEFATNGTVDWSVGQNSNDAFEVYENGSGATTRLTIKEGGNVGIGTSSPLGQLHISGSDVTDQVIIENTDTGANTGPDLVLWRNSASPAASDALGNLVFRGEDGAGNPHDYAGIRAVIGNVVNGSELGKLIFSTAQTGGNTEAMRIDGGNVGIGTTSPGSKLEVSSGVGANGDSILTISADTDNSTSSSSPKLLMLQKGSTKTSLIEMDSSDRTHFSNATGYYFSGGNVGIGTTSPSYKLDVNGVVRGDRFFVGTNTAASQWAFHARNNNSTADSGLYFNNNSSEIYLRNSSNVIGARIRSNSASYFNGGDVGIGTASPQERLHVSGETHPSIKLSSSSDGNYNVILNCGYRNEALNLSVGGYKVFTTEGFNTPETTHLYSNNSKALSLASNQAATFTSTVTATNFINSSDKRLKENIEEVRDNNVEVNWKTFNFKTEKEQKRYGVIAQELEKTNPEFVREDSQGFKSVAYIDLLIAKIAELEARIQKLEK